MLETTGTGIQRKLGESPAGESDGIPEDLISVQIMWKSVMLKPFRFNTMPELD